jgi:hypothetical protein
VSLFRRRHRVHEWRRYRDPSALSRLRDQLRREPMARPVTLAAKLYHANPEIRPTACRCPGGPCRVHPFAFDMERLLSPQPGKPW